MNAIQPSNIDPDEQPIDFTQTHIREFINSQVNKFAQQRDKDAAEANETERNLCAQLMLLTTVLLTANVVVLGDHANLTALTHQQSLLVFFSLLGLSLSTMAGIKYYFANIAFYDNWADARHKVVIYLSAKRYRTIKQAHKKVDRMQKGDTQVSPFWLRAQIRLLLAVFISYILLVAALLFSFISFQDNFPWNLFN